jgi:ABC-type transport system involved in multi-copper enzyme maturation permease subunit
VTTNGVPLRENPVLRRELIERVQGTKVVVFITIWLLLLTGILVLAFQGTVGINQEFGLDIASLGRVGRELYEWVLFGMTILVLFLVPGLTSGSITGERERQTLVPLQMTLMRPIDIIVGKLAAALAFLVLLIIAAMPLLATSVLVGGVGLFTLVRGLGMLIFTGLVLGAVCVYISSRFKRTTASTVLSYAIAIIFAVGSFVGMLVFAIVAFSVDGNSDGPPAEIVAFNPFAGIADALPRSADGGAFDDTFTPFGGLRTMIDELGNDGFFNDDRDRGPYIWIYYVVIGSAVLFLSVRGASRGVTTPAETER